jgi:acyl-CoA dehydrogenase
MLFIILILLVFWLLLVFEASLIIHTAVIAAMLFLASWSWPMLAVALSWCVFFPVALILNIPQLRKQILTRPLLGLFRRIKPRLSRTEQAALEAGDVWWERDLFSGRPDWQKLLDLPAARLSEEEQAFMEGPVDELCTMLNDWEITNERQDLPPEAWDFIKARGFFALIIPKRYGGLEFSAMANSHLIAKLASRSLTAAVTVMVPNSLGPAELLMHYGTDEQRDYYLPRLARGEEIPCFALTGPEAGSDAASIPDIGVVSKGQWQGEEIVGIRLNWEKRYITLGPVATLLGLAFRLSDPELLLGHKKDLGITCALVPTDLPGIEIGQRHNPLNVPFMNGPNWGKDVFIPLDMIIGGVQGAGRGWQMLMESLSAGRGISLPALSVGAAKMVSRDTGAYAAVRRQFGLPIGRFEGIEEVLTHIAGETWLMDAARHLTCAALDQGLQPAVISAIVKQNLTERMRSVVNNGMDVEGGKGICLGPNNHLAGAYQAIPIGITVEGANILTRSMIIFGQGAIRCHPWILKELHAADNSDAKEALDAFDEAFFGHIGLGLRNASSALFYGLTGGHFIDVPETAHKRWFQKTTRFATAFSLTGDLLMGTLGGGLKLREKLTGRMADILSELYFLSAALKAAETKSDVDQEALLEWNCRRSLFRIQESLLGVIRNLPLPLNLLLRVLVFPLGSWAAPPDDELGKKIAAMLLNPGPEREILTAGLFLSKETEAPDRLLEEAFRLATETDALEKDLRHAIRAGTLDGDSPDLLEQAVNKGILNPDQRQKLEQARELRKRVIAVDAF